MKDERGRKWEEIVVAYVEKIFYRLLGNYSRNHRTISNMKIGLMAENWPRDLPEYFLILYP